MKRTKKQQLDLLMVAKDENYLEKLRKQEYMKWRTNEKKKSWLLNKKQQHSQSETDKPQHDFWQLKKKKANSNDQTKTYSKHQIMLTGKIEI